MAYVPITPNEIATGEPVTNSTQTKIKDNLEAHESRITSLEGGSAVVYPPIILRVNGPYQFANATRVLKTTLNFNLTVTGVRLITDTQGNAGTTAVDVLYKRGVASYKSILTTRPSVSYLAGNDAKSNDAVLDLSESSLLAGDILALDITSVQTGGLGFMVRIDYNKT